MGGRCQDRKRALPGTDRSQLEPGHLGVEQVGDYAVAGKMDEGIYGIGDTANTTWFVPGDGRVGNGIGWTNVAPQVLATQVTGGRGSDRMVVFSLHDGKVLDYGLSDDLMPMSAVVYPGGFAVEVAPKSPAPTPSALWFFDTSGKRLGQSVASGSLDTLTRDLPITYSARRATVYSNEGYPLARITGFDRAGEFCCWEHDCSSISRSRNPVISGRSTTSTPARKVRSARPTFPASSEVTAGQLFSIPAPPPSDGRHAESTSPRAPSGGPTRLPSDPSAMSGGPAPPSSNCPTTGPN